MNTDDNHIDDEMTSQTQSNPSLIYEETPPIVQNEDPDVYSVPKPQNNAASIITAIIAFILLFVIGFWLSGSIRKYISTMITGKSDSTTDQTTAPSPTPFMSADGIDSTPQGGTQSGMWKTYEVLNGKSRIAYNGISYTLPPETLSPICDGSACGSQGTYLPGGTRFTVALRGEGQVLPDFRGKIISDLSGIPFPLKETTLRGRPATEFTGGFKGTTVGGYVFSQMHGYMIPLTDVLSLEINHFTPNGIQADFAKDDLLFDQIVQSLVLPGSVSDKGIAPTTPSVTVSPTATVSSKALQDEVCAKNGTLSSLTFSEASALANASDCKNQGTILSTRTCNSTTGVWWIDVSKTGSTCKNICEVSVVAKTAKFISNCL